MKTYVINLNKNIEKYDTVYQIFSNIGIYPERFEGIYGKDLSQDFIDKITSPYVQYTINNGRYADCDIGTLGAIGCYLSHLKLWKMLVESNDDIFFILEDDAHLLNEYSVSYINKYINDVNTYQPNWDLIFVGWTKPYPRQPFEKDIKITENIYKINEITFCLHAYIINKKGAIKLLKNAFPIIHQIDSYISFMCMYRDFNAYRGKDSYIIQNNLKGTDIQTDHSLKIYFSRLDNNQLKKYTTSYSTLNVYIISILVLLIIVLSYFLIKKKNI